ncbi:hypothetical protein L1987_16350 [Smallanthus sonchifolius]|uniref:Uncharacterized protein n=1 Tax=Smallanthus sonchifolius TaxID=185202 RepID=A0ACB9J941_9ASTR|nr:hypothetical protein L1987_16350 [Smallanthus sonchifolius]
MDIWIQTTALTVFSPKKLTSTLLGSCCVKFCVKKQEEGKKVEEEAKQAAGDKKKGEESKDGVEDHKTRQIIVNRGKVDPLKVLARVKNKNHQKVKLLPLTEEPKKLEQGEPYKQKEVVLSVDLHCQGCARKVRQCLKNFEGVERVLTDCDNHMVVVKGKNLNLLKVIERVKKKLRRDVELLSPVSKSLTEEPKKLEQQEPPKQEEKKDEPLSVITVVLKVHMHCEACARDIRKCILRMKGVESAVADLNNSQVTVKGTFSAVEIVDHVHKKTGKGVVILMQDHDIS